VNAFRSADFVLFSILAGRQKAVSACKICLCAVWGQQTDLHWVRALTVLMHLGLIDVPFVPRNLISAQESPVPLPKFQMAPGFKVLMFSGSKKGTQIYCPFLSKSPGKRIPSRVPNGAPMERDTCTEGIFTSRYISLTYLSGSPVKEPSF
jgi:hypothetical protein